MSSVREIKQWPLTQLKEHPLQSVMFVDVSQADLEALAGDIKQNGLRNPVEILTDGRILSGHQRVRAALSLGWTEIDVIVRDDHVDDPKAAEIHFITENLNRRQLSKIAKARSIARCIELEYGKPVRELFYGQKDASKGIVAKRMGIKVRTVNRHLLAIESPLEVQLAVERGHISFGDAGQVALRSKEKQSVLSKRLRVIYKAADSGINHRQAVKDAIRECLEKSVTSSEAVKSLGN
ncbi:hypothetical protein BH11PLA2_BH11PLA2_27040 [soil metagenome]